ncbi:hypothetical protein [Nitrospira sp. Kam-Ns4a]
MRPDARVRGEWRRGDGSRESNDGEWLGAEAHVPYRERRPGWPERFRRPETGFSGLALGLAFTTGVLLGGGLALWRRARRGSNDQ